MPTISAKVSKKELDAITEYANACGETVSNLIRKCVITEASFLNCFNDSKEYDYGISIPDNASGEEKDKIVQGTVNKIRRILGLEEVKLWKIIIVDFFNAVWFFDLYSNIMFYHMLD